MKQSMKYIALVIFVFVTAACTKNVNPKTNFSITGKVEHLDQSKPYILSVREIRRDSIAVDTIHVNPQGEFAFKGYTDTLAISTLYLEGGVTMPIFVDKNWKIKISGDALNPDLVMVHGGNANDGLTEFKIKNQKLLQERTEILSSLSDSSDSKLKLKNVNIELLTAAREYISQNPASITSVMLLESFYKINTTADMLDKELNILQGDAANFYLTDRLRKYSERLRRSQEGAFAPNFKIKDANHKDVSVTDFRGKYLFLIFESGSSPVNNTDRTKIVELYNKLKKSSLNVEFVSVILDSKIKMRKSATDSIKWKILTDEEAWGSNAAKLYHITQLPYSILISPEGRIMNRDVPLISLVGGFKELNDKAKKLKKK